MAQIPDWWRGPTERLRFFVAALGRPTLWGLVVAVSVFVFSAIGVWEALRDALPMTAHLPPFYVIVSKGFALGAPWAAYISLALWFGAFEYLFRLDKRKFPDREEFDRFKGTADRAILLHKLVQLRSDVENFEDTSDEKVAEILDKIEHPPRAYGHKMRSAGDDYLATGTTLEAEARRLLDLKNENLGAGPVSDAEAIAGAARRPPMANEAMGQDHFRFEVNAARQRERLKLVHRRVVDAIYRLTRGLGS